MPVPMIQIREPGEGELLQVVFPRGNSPVALIQETCADSSEGRPSAIRFRNYLTGRGVVVAEASEPATMPCPSVASPDGDRLAVVNGYNTDIYSVRLEGLAATGLDLIGSGSPRDRG